MMKLMMNFPHSLPVNWPAHSEEESYIVEDGNDHRLEVNYQDAHFVRPMAPWKPEEMRAAYQSAADYRRKRGATL